MLDDFWDSKLGRFVLVLFFFGLSFLSFRYPNALDGLLVGGRRGLIKSILVWLWGVPLGITALLFGVIFLIGMFASDD